MGIVLVSHDQGCLWARPGAEAEIDGAGHVTAIRSPGYGHTDAAKRFADTYNMHKAAGAARGWIAVEYATGGGGADVYDSREAAVASLWPYEDWYFYCWLREPSMTVCAAESLLRYRRVMSDIERPDRDIAGGGYEVIRRLAVEDQEAQIRAVRTGRGALPLGRRRDAR